jgi:hypothetical protein
MRKIGSLDSSIDSIAHVLSVLVFLHNIRKGFNPGSHRTPIIVVVGYILQGGGTVSEVPERRRRKAPTSILFSTNSAPATGAFIGGNASEIAFKAFKTSLNAFQARPLTVLAVFGELWAAAGSTAEYGSARAAALVGTGPCPWGGLWFFFLWRFKPGREGNPDIAHFEDDEC